MRRLAARVLAAPVILYALSVAFGKGLVLVTLPFLSMALPRRNSSGWIWLPR